MSPHSVKKKVRTNFRVSYCRNFSSGNQLRQQEGRARGKSSNHNGLRSRTPGPRASEAALDIAKPAQGGQSDYHRPGERDPGAVQEQIRPQRDETSADARNGNRQGTLQSTLGIRLLQAKLEAHHEVHPLLRLAGEGLDDGGAFMWCESVVGKDILHLARLLVWDLLHFAHLAQPLAFVVLGIALRGEISAQTHGDGAGGDLSQPRDDNDVAVVHRTGKPGGQREGHSQPVRHSNNDIADNVARREVTFNVWCLWHGFLIRNGIPHTAGRAARPRVRPGRRGPWVRRPAQASTLCAPRSASPVRCCPAARSDTAADKS